ncbi:MAG: Unknown protein [uncultured Aureispira sp.]|uniref:Phage shock protein B n=1 Tax=uncultured Aureispira sp. TaxID=1331704 RepID=A0A6S6UE95_9BACT|nr:MAG: Unknown protein [uncultured Aureispira sp.]
MQHLAGIIAILAVFSIPLVAIVGSFYLKLQKLKISQNGDGDTVKDLRQQVGHLMAENDEVKDRLKNLEHILSDESRRINIDYEKEQIKVDQQNKFEL